MAGVSKAAVIKSNAREFCARLKQVGRQYHFEIMYGMAEMGDVARTKAVSEHMVKGTQGRGRRIFNPTKLTIRTGYLARVIAAKYGWEYSDAKAKLNSDNMKFTIIPQRSGNTFFYLGRFYVTDTNNEKLKYRLMHEYGFARKRRGYGEFDKKNTNSRIPARPFMGPAIEGEFGRISEHLVKNCSLLKTTVTI